MATDIDKLFTGHETGTPGFIDPRMTFFEARNKPQDFRWDLTSFFMVLLFFVHTLEGRGQERKPELGGIWDWRLCVVPVHDIPVEQWKILKSEEAFQKFFTRTTTTYMNYLRPLMTRLRTVIIDDYEYLRHQTVIDIIAEEAAKLPCFRPYMDDYPVPKSSRVLGYDPSFKSAPRVSLKDARSANLPVETKPSAAQHQNLTNAVMATALL